MLLKAARALRAEGRTPPGARDASVYRVRGCSTVVSDSTEWRIGVREAVTVPPAAD